MKYTNDGSGIYCEKVDGLFLCVPFSVFKSEGFIKENAVTMKEIQSDSNSEEKPYTL